MTGKCPCSVIESVRDAVLSRIRRDRRGAPDGVKEVLEAVATILWNPSMGAAALMQTVSPAPEALLSFQERFGCGVSAYIDQRRLEAACRIVRESEAPINEIAVAMGFPGPAHFTKWLKRRIGQAPSQLRAAESGDVPRPATTPPTAPSAANGVSLTPILGRQALVRVLEPLGVAALMRFLRKHYPAAFHSRQTGSCA